MSAMAQEFQRRSNFVITIDGPAASGKGSLTRWMGEKLGYETLDTGALYRAIGYLCREYGVDIHDNDALEAKAADLEAHITAEILDSDELRTPEMGEAASVVSANPTVRQALLNFQKSFCLREPGAVLDGRDTGTVICPDADLKLFVTASPEVRAERRFKDFQKKGISTRFDAVLADIKKRDERDSNRSAAPLKAAEDAHILDTSDMGIEDVRLWAERLYVARRAPQVF